MYAKEKLPEDGDYSVILNSKDEAVCLIQTKKVMVLPFNEVTESHAYKEGEGDRSFEYWKKVHIEFFREELSATGISFDENMKVVCEEFENVWTVEDDTEDEQYGRDLQNSSCD